jgi:general secretion pathway protein H
VPHLPPGPSCPAKTRAYTLIELLIVIMVLGIASAVLIPSLGSTGVLRVQAAVRQIVADITVAQSEALAYQRGRAIIFDVETNSYKVVEVRSGEIDPDANLLSTVELSAASVYGDAKIVSASFDGDTTLIFDEIGAPTLSPGQSQPTATGVLTVEGSGNRFRIEIDGYTGRVIVRDMGPIAN